MSVNHKQHLTPSSASIIALLVFFAIFSQSCNDELGPCVRDCKAELKKEVAATHSNHWRDWVRHQVHRICDLVELNRVSAHGMRGAHATVAIDGGLSAELVAGTLGHEDSKTTKDSYALEGVEEAAIRRKLFKLLEGGRRK